MGETPFERFTSAGDFSGGFRSWQEQEPSPTNPTKTNALVMVACSTCRLAAQDLVQVLGWVPAWAQVRARARGWSGSRLWYRHGSRDGVGATAFGSSAASGFFFWGGERAVVSRFGIGRIDSFQRRL